MQAAIKERRIKDRTAPTDPLAELTRYLTDPITEECPDILNWWKENCGQYPVLSRMAANYLAVQGSSVPCERQFSSAGLVDTKRRNRLGAEKFGSIKYVKAHHRNTRKTDELKKFKLEESQKRAREQATLVVVDTNKRAKKA